MSKNLKEEDLRLNIIVNGDPARAEIGALIRKTQDLASANEQMRAEQRKLREEGKHSSNRYKELTASIKANQLEITQNKAKTSGLRSELGLHLMTISELITRHRELRVVQRNTIPGTPAWKKLNDEILSVNLRMAQLSKETAATEGVMCRMASSINQYIGSVTATFAAAAMYGSLLQKTIRSHSALDEAMSNARKTTNMTRKEIEELNKNLTKIDTRTAQNDLLSLARIGGKLGIAKREIEGFTRAADVIKISLGKDLGDNVETTIGQIGKLVNIFKLNKEFGIEQGMMKTAAAVNELGMSSVANEANIVEFMRRVGGVGSSAKMSLANIAGLGATLDGLGQTMEVAGTSMSQVITGMFRRTDAFAYAAKMSVKDFKKLMSEDMNEALIRMAEGMGSDGAAMGKIVTALDSLKLDGSRATGVLTALAQNTSVLREQQEIANRAFDEGISCIKEFNVMNTTAEAITEKKKKQITDESAAIGKLLIPAYHDSLSAMASLIKMTRTLIEWLINSKGAIVGLVAIYAAYVAAVKINEKWDSILLARKKLLVIWSKAHQITLMREAITMTGVTASTQLMAAAQLLLAGNLRAAGLAFKAFFVSMGPIGWVTLAVSALTSAVMLFSNKTSAVAKFQKALSDHMRNAATEAASERSELDKLKGKLEGCRVGTKEYNDTKQQIIDKFGKYDSTLKTETLTVQALRDKYNLLTEAIMQSAKTRQYTKFLESQQTVFDEQFGETSDKLWETLNDQYYTEKASKYYTQIMNAFFGGQSLDAWLTTGSNKAQKLVRKLHELREAQSASDKQAQSRFAITSAQKTTTKQTTTNNPTISNPTTNTATTDLGGVNDKDKWSLDNDTAFMAAKTNLRQQFADGEIATEKEYQGRLLALEITALRTRLAANAEAGTDRSKLQIQLADKFIELNKNELSITDADFQTQKQALRIKFADGAIATEQEYQDKLLSLEIAFSKTQLTSSTATGEVRQQLAAQLADKLIELKKREQQQSDAVEDLRIQNLTNATDRENADYERKKRQYAGNTAALEQLAVAHNRNIAKIDLQRAISALKQDEEEYKQSRQILQERHKIELQTANLTKTERARLKREQTNELKVFDEEYLRNLISQLQELNSTGTIVFRDLQDVIQSIDIDTDLLSEEEKNELIRRIKETTAALNAAEKKVEESSYSFTQSQGGSLFGFSQDDWSLFFENIENGKFGAEEMGMALLATADAANMAMELYSGYDKMMTAKENAELKKYKKNNDVKKNALQSRLDAGLITQEQHSAEVERMDAEYEQKQEELRIKQAKRQKAMSIVSTTINTAAGVVKTLSEWGLPWGLIPAGIMAAMGAAQIAMIASTPIEGAEMGGFAVERTQDGKKFNARLNPDARGYVNRPTVLVGENGMEYVIPADAMQNPTARPIINAFESARKKGRLKDADFTQIIPEVLNVPGYNGGGSICPQESVGRDVTISTTNYTDLLHILTKLSKQLEKPIPAEVSIMGNKGINQKMDEYNRMKNRGKIG